MTKIDSFVKSIQDETVPVSNLLREAKLLARDADQADSLVWIEAELGGYKKGDKYPKYRTLTGQMKAWNPYHGWVPVVHPSSDIETKLCTRSTNQSVREIEELLSNKSDTYEMPYPASVAEQILQGNFKTKLSMFIGRSSLVGVLNAVRNRLLDWTDELKRKGLLGYEELIPAEVISGGDFFPVTLLKKVPRDVQALCEEFNFSIANKKPLASMLLLRRLLPLAVVRKFQSMGKEAEIKPDDDFLDTKALLGQVEKYLNEKRVYKEITNYKLLIDSSQHSYSFSVELSDVPGPAVALRVLLEDLFG